MMFDATKGREGVNLAIARKFLACAIPFKATCFYYFKQMVCAINEGTTSYKPLGYEAIVKALTLPFATFMARKLE